MKNIRFLEVPSLKILNSLKEEKLSNIDVVSVSADIADQVENLKGFLDKKMYFVVKVPAMYNGIVVQLKLFTRNIIRLQDKLSKSILPEYQRNLKEYQLLNRKFSNLGLKFRPDNIVFDAAEESSLEAWFNELSRYEENYQFLTYPTSFNSASNFFKDESYNPSSRLFLDRSVLYLDLENLLKITGKCYTDHIVLTTIDKIQITGENVIRLVENLIFGFDITGVEIRNQRYTSILTKELKDFCGKTGRDVFLNMSCEEPDILNYFIAQQRFNLKVAN